jgi:hypothetical protein
MREQITLIQTLLILFSIKLIIIIIKNHVISSFIFGMEELKYETLLLCFFFINIKE